jgi:hypothetical protein
MSDGTDRLHRQFHDAQYQYLALLRRKRDPRKRRPRIRKSSYCVPAGTVARFFKLDLSQALAAASNPSPT